MMRTTEEVSRFQHLFPNLQLVNARMGIWLPKAHFNTSSPVTISCLMVSGELVVELTLVKCHQRLAVYPGANVHCPTLA